MSVDLDVVEPLVAQGVSVGVVVGMLVSTAAAGFLAIGDLGHREVTRADGWRPFARWRFPDAWSQRRREELDGFRSRTWRVPRRAL